MTKPTTSKSKPRTKRLKVSKPIVEIDPEASADEEMVLDNVPFTDSLKRISEQARDWEDTALSPRGPKPYERAGRGQNLMLARATVIIGIVLFAAILGNAIYFSFQMRTLNRAMTSLTLENKKLKEEMATLAMIKMIKLARVETAAPVSQPKTTQVASAPVAAATPAATKPATPPAATQPKMAKVKPPATTWKSDFQ